MSNYDNPEEIVRMIWRVSKYMYVHYSGAEPAIDGHWPGRTKKKKDRKKNGRGKRRLVAWH